MGYNTAMIVRNDFLHEIEKDPKFGAKVAIAIRSVGRPNKPYHGQSFDVLTSEHADHVQIVAIAANSIRRLGFGGGWQSDDEAILRHLAESMGFYVVKKRALT